MKNRKLLWLIPIVIVFLTLVVIIAFYLGRSAGLLNAATPPVSGSPSATQTFAADPSPSPTVTGELPSDEGWYTYRPAMLVRFYADTTSSALAPKIAEEYCRDFDNYTEAAPIAFGAEDYGGRKVTLTNSWKRVELYLTGLDDGVWVCALQIPNDATNSEIDALRAQLAEWKIPEA